MKYCIFFDIDGTLVDTHGAGRAAFRRSVCEVLEIEDDLSHLSFAGSTDLSLFRSVCRKHGREPEARVERAFFALLHQHMQGALTRERVRLLPGVGSLLNALSGMEQVVLALLTGNAESCARLKLAPHDLNRYFDFGAFGDEFADRADIARMARERASARTDGPVLFRVVGDTPLDVGAADAIHAPCLAVATGNYDQASLLESGAAFVVPDLMQTDCLVKWLTAIGPREEIPAMK